LFKVGYINQILLSKPIYNTEVQPRAGRKRSPLFSNENVWRLEKTLAQISPWGLLHFATSPERLAAATRPEHANMSSKRKK
jgi:hypothetical protein